MLESAKLYMKSGNFQKYCDIQMQLGNFEDAMAVAPKVSLRYWQKCLDAHKLHLQQQIKEFATNSSASLGQKQNPVQDLIEYSLLAGDVDKAADLLSQNKDTIGAKTVKFVAQANGYP